MDKWERYICTANLTFEYVPHSFKRVFGTAKLMSLIHMSIPTLSSSH